MAPIYLGKMVVPSSLRYIENLAAEPVPKKDSIIFYVVSSPQHYIK